MQNSSVFEAIDASSVGIEAGIERRTAGSPRWWR